MGSVWWRGLRTIQSVTLCCEPSVSVIGAQFPDSHYFNLLLFGQFNWMFPDSIIRDHVRVWTDCKQTNPLLIFFLCPTVNPVYGLSSNSRMIRDPAASSSPIVTYSSVNYPKRAGSGSSGGYSEAQLPHENSAWRVSLEEINSDKYADEMKCQYYNRTQCNQTNTGCGDTFEICHSADTNDKPSSCYALWYNTSTTGITIEYKGCWIGSIKDCRNEPFTDAQQCLQSRFKNKNLRTLFFCCCSGMMCNREVLHIPEPFDTPTDAPEHGKLFICCVSRQLPTSLEFF